MEELKDNMLEELRQEARRFALQIGVRQCMEDCSMCWVDRSDMPCAQRDIINAYIAGAEWAMKNR